MPLRWYFITAIPFRFSNNENHKKAQNERKKLVPTDQTKHICIELFIA